MATTVDRRPMPGVEYLCRECGNRFRTADGAAADKRSLMCPACGGIDLSMVLAERPRPQVMRAKLPLQSGDLWPGPGRMSDPS